VTVNRFDVLASRRAEHAGCPVLDVDVRVEVSSGTYVRALARDLGRALGTGGHLTALRRTRVGPYDVEQAATLEALAERFAVLPMAEAARAAFPARELSEQQVRTLRYGQRLEPTGGPDRPPGPVAGFAPDGSLVALLEDHGDRARSLLVVPPD
jgi:tRNA pseudouridine55 synthase